MYKGYKINICSDDDPMNPRDNDNLGTMLCFHSRYNLGDKQTDIKSNDFSGWEEMENYLIKKEKACVILPLYLYDHSGITMRTTSFNDRWDSGQVGFAYVTSEKIRKEYSVKSINKAIKDKVTSVLEAEVEEYDQFIRGDVYGYDIRKITKCDLDCEHEETVDSCWGFYGEIDYCLTEAKAVVDSYKEDPTKSTTPAEAITA
jgi:hypothetical protein